MNQELLAKSKAKVIMSKDLVKEVTILHRECPQGKEWSGLLIWRLISGDLVNYQNLVIKAEHVYPMDFGDATFTSFDEPLDWLKCFTQFPQIDPEKREEYKDQNWFIGKIH